MVDLLMTQALGEMEACSMLLPDSPPKSQKPMKLHVKLGTCNLLTCTLFPFPVSCCSLFHLCFTYIDMKVSGHYVVTLLNWTPIFVWYIARFILKNGHQKHMCYEEIGVCAHINIHTILDSTI